MVLVDAYSERIESLLTPAQWQALVQLNVTQGSDTIEPIPGYGDLETLPYGSSDAVMRRAAAVNPLRAMPLAVLARGQAFALTQAALGFSPETLEIALRAATTQLATLVPNARLFIARDSGHDIHQDHPQLVTEAIRQVVEGVRQPDTWYDLTSCCTQ